MEHSAKLKRMVWVLSTVLVGLLAGIGLLIWKDQTDTPVASTTESITEIRLLRKGFSDIVMTKIQGLWQLTSPCTLAVNAQRLEPLLGALQPAGHSYKASDVDLDAAGLTPAQATVYLNHKRIELGNTDLQGNRRYALSTDTVEFVPEWVLSLINGGITAFVKLEPFGAKLSQLTINGLTHDNPDELDIWRDLSARQILEWSTLNLSASNDSFRFQATIDSQQHYYELHKHSDFIALRVENAACAYILPVESFASLFSSL